jgi:hypothetical protein
VSALPFRQFLIIIVTKTPMGDLLLKTVSNIILDHILDATDIGITQFHEKLVMLE